jgi:hypothetical protein
MNILFFIPPLPHMLDVIMMIIVVALPTMYSDMLERVWGN